MSSFTVVLYLYDYVCDRDTRSSSSSIWIWFLSNTQVSLFVSFENIILQWLLLSVLCSICCIFRWYNVFMSHIFTSLTNNTSDTPFLFAFLKYYNIHKYEEGFLVILEFFAGIWKLVCDELMKIKHCYTSYHLTVSVYTYKKIHQSYFIKISFHVRSETPAQSEYY